MRVTINGSIREIDPVDNLEELVGVISPTSQGLIIQHNNRFVARDQWCCRQVQDGDAIDLISMVGGG